MIWSGWPTTLVSQLTMAEWKLAIRPKREVLVGYALRQLGAWHVFGDDRWVWFNGVITGSSGAVEIVSQWAEAENLGTSHRHWRWVHWRNPSSETAYVAPRFLLAPPLEERDLSQVEETSRTRRIWSLADVASNEIAGTGVFVPPPDDDGDVGGNGGDTGRGIRAGMAIRALEGQRIHHVTLTGDERFLPLEELDARLSRLLPRASSGGDGEERD